MKIELLKGLSEEQLQKMRACKNSNEILALAKKEGIELTDEQLAAVNGGCGEPQEKDTVCPCCGCGQITFEEKEVNSRDVTFYFCPNCNFHWQKY